MMNRVAIISVPKSGTNLLQKLLELAGLRFSGNSIGTATCFGRYELAKRIFRGPRVGETPVLVGLEVDVVCSPKWLRCHLAHAKGYVTGHATYTEELHGMFLKQGYRILFIVRHPAAVLLSWANYIVEDGYYWKDAQQYFSQLDLEKRIRAFLHGIWIREGVYHHSFSTILSRALPWIGKKEVLAVRYEDLVGIKGGGDDDVQRAMISKVLDFIGRRDADVDYIQDHLYGGTHTFRKGKLARWKTILTPDLKREIHETLASFNELQELEYI